MPFLMHTTWRKYFQALWRAENLPTVEQRRAQRVLVLGASMLAIQCLAWSVFFAWQGAWMHTLPTLLLLGFALGSLSLIDKNTPSFVEVLMFLAVLLLITGVTVLFDAPSRSTPATTHLFLLPLAVAAFMAFSSTHTWVSAVLASLCLASFLVLAVLPWPPVSSLHLPEEVRAIAKWLNSISSMGLLGMLLYVLNSDAKLHGGLDKELQTALDEAQFVLYFQPQMDQQHRVRGAEVLLRWKHPLRGLLPPSAFIDHAERNGLMVPLGQWVLEQSCAQLRRWRKEALFAPLELAVNVSQTQFRQENFASEVIRLVQAYGIAPRNLELELTETLMVLNMDDLQQKMQRLVDCGLRFSLDDFGTGFSSLSLLRQLPLHTLKIDHSFVMDVPRESNSRAIVKTLLSLAQNLNLNVVAEGVETLEQHTFLKDHGCARFQGHLYSKPLPLDAFMEFVRQHNTPAQPPRAMAREAVA